MREGDADVNAAVACSFLEAKYGYSVIPKRYIKVCITKICWIKSLRDSWTCSL